MNKTVLTILKAAIEVTVVLFGAFGGILTKLFHDVYIPNLDFITGMAQFISLALFLFFSVFLSYQLLKTDAGQKKFIKIWLWITSVMLLLLIGSSIAYYKNFNSLTIRHEKWNTYVVRGDELTDDAKKICIEDSKFQNKEACEDYLLFDYFNSDEVLNKYQLWKKESVEHSMNILLANYLILTICLSIVIFSLVELLTWPLLKKVV